MGAPKKLVLEAAGLEVEAAGLEDEVAVKVDVG